jgi:hypothetical protein
LIRAPRGSTALLAIYAFLYFALYALFGLLLKVFQGPLSQGFPGQTDLEFLVYSTAGSALICLGVIFGGRWWKAAFTSRELLYIGAAGTCTAFVIPTTKLMYSLPISVMVAMILMRGSIIVISRIVDGLLLAQGISRKKPAWEENLAVLFALLAVGMNIFYARSGDFEFLKHPTALAILITYLVSYSLRIYFMNYFKFTRSASHTADKKNYFALEQLTASFWIFGFVGLALLFPLPGGIGIAAAIKSPHPLWFSAMMLAGIPFGIGAFFSAFLFLFEGRTATFSALANRLASLMAGVASTLLFALFFAGKWPKSEDWISLALVLVAVGLLAKVEMRATTMTR